MRADIGIRDRGKLALRAAVDGDAPHRVILVLVGPDETDHPPVGGKRHARYAHVVGQKIARVHRRMGQFELLLVPTVLFAFGHVWQAGSGIGDAAAIGRYGDGADAFELGDVFGSHRPRLRLCGDRGGGEQGGGSQRRAKFHGDTVLFVKMVRAAIAKPR